MYGAALLDPLGHAGNVEKRNEKKQNDLIRKLCFTEKRVVVAPKSRLTAPQREIYTRLVDLEVLYVDYWPEALDLLHV